MCECDQTASECNFKLEVAQLRSMTSYKLARDSDGNLFCRSITYSTSYEINDLGQLVPGSGTTLNDARCSLDDERFGDRDCSEPMIIDATAPTAFIGVNGLIPGPTLVVHHNQTVVVDVFNRLENQELTIHWHGIHQTNTPWMDGVPHVTQCGVETYASFKYIFKATPSGTMWYHSHVGTQRIEGVFGALIVKESEDDLKEAEWLVQERLGETSILSMNRSMPSQCSTGSS